MFKAFTYMFDDNKFISKYLVYTGYVTLPILIMLAGVLISITSRFLGIIVMLFGILPLVACSGYFVSCTKALMVQNEHAVLPYFDFKRDISVGMKLSIVGLLAALMLLVFCLIPIVNFLVILTYFFLSTAMMVNFIINDYSIASYFNISECINLIKNSGTKYIKAIGMIILITIINGVMQAIVRSFDNPLLIIGAMIVEGVIQLYFFFVSVYVVANATNENLNIN